MWNPNSDNKTEDVSIPETTKHQLNIVDKAIAAGNIAAGNGNTSTTTTAAKNLVGESSSSNYGGGGGTDCAYNSNISCGGEVDSGFLSGPQVVEDYDDDLEGGRGGNNKPTIPSVQLNIVSHKEQELADDYFDSGCIEEDIDHHQRSSKQNPSITTTAATPQIQQRVLLVPDEDDDDQMILDSGIDAGVTESLCNLSLNSEQKLNNLGAAAKNKSEGYSSTNNRDTTGTSAWEIFYQQDHEGDTQLHLACLTGDVDVVAALIRMAPHPCLFNIQNDEAQTVLHLAVLYGQPKILRMLLIAGAKPTVRDRNGNTPLHLACMSGDIQCVKAITIPISASEINEAHRSYGHLSSDRTTSYLDCANLPADLEIRNYDGERCVHLAAQGGHIDILRDLVWFGADINAREGKSGRTPLHIAIECCNEILANFLLEECSKLNLETATYAGLTAYQVACVLNNSTMQNNLEQRGAEPLTPPESDYESSDIETDLDDSQLYDRFGDPRYFANYNGGNPINVA